MNIEFTLWMGDIQPWMNEIFIKNSFNHFGFRPKSIKLIKDKKYNVPLNYCFINFDSILNAKQALNKLKGIKIPNTNFEFKLNWANKNFENFKSVYVANIPLRVKDSELYDFFKKRYQSVLHATIIRENKGKNNYGFIYIGNDDEYKNCLQEMNGAIFFNSIIKVKERRKKNPEENKNNIEFNIKNINIKDIKSFYPKNKEIENIESNETNSSSEDEAKKISKRKFSDNLDILESNDHPLIHQNILKTVDKMFNYYKINTTVPGTILYYSSVTTKNNSED